MLSLNAVLPRRNSSGNSFQSYSCGLLERNDSCIELGVWTGGITRPEDNIGRDRSGLNVSGAECKAVSVRGNLATETLIGVYPDKICW